MDLIVRAREFAVMAHQRQSPNEPVPKEKKHKQPFVETNIGIALPNGSQKKHDRTWDKICNCDPDILSKWSKWGNMNDHNKDVMEQKIADGRLVRNQRQSLHEAVTLHMQPGPVGHWGRETKIGCEVYLYTKHLVGSPATQAGSPATPPKKASPAAAKAPPSATTSAATFATTAEPPQPAKAKTRAPPLQPATDPPVARWPHFKSPPSPWGMDPAYIPDWMRPKATSSPAAASTTTSAAPATAKVVGSKENSAAAEPKAAPHKAQPQPTSTAAEPATAIPGQNTLMRKRLQWSPNILAPRPPQLPRDDPFQWLRLHSLECYSVGLEYMAGCLRTSRALKEEIHQLLKRPRPIRLSQSLGARFVADMIPTAAESDVEVLNCRTNFYDPEESEDSRYHVGYWPKNMETFCLQAAFEPWLRDTLDRISVQAEMHRLDPAAEPKTVHLLSWCNRGTHRSVAACRVLTQVCAELNLHSQLVCNLINIFLFSFFFCTMQSEAAQVPHNTFFCIQVAFPWQVQHVPGMHSNNRSCKPMEASCQEHRPLLEKREVWTPSTVSRDFHK